MRMGTFPEFQMGVTGIILHLTGFSKNTDGCTVNVLRVEPDSPANGILQAGDVLLEVNGTRLEGKPHLWFTLTPETRHLLGTALTQAEATDGKLTFKLLRSGAAKQVTIEISVLGPYSETWPLNCPKSDTFVKSASAAVRKHLRNADPEANPITESRVAGLQSVHAHKIIGYCLAGLFLLSTENPDDLEVVRACLKRTTHELPDGRPMHTWIYAYRGLLLAEYYLRTGEDFVLPELQAIARAAKENQAASGWGHNGRVATATSKGAC